jgi:hypothetical protein
MSLACLDAVSTNPRDQATAYCSIGFQPVSGRATRHPRKSVIHGTGTRLEGVSSRGPNDRLEAYAMGVMLLGEANRETPVRAEPRPTCAGASPRPTPYGRSIHAIVLVASRSRA